MLCARCYEIATISDGRPIRGIRYGHDGVHAYRVGVVFITTTNCSRSFVVVVVGAGKRLFFTLFITILHKRCPMSGLAHVWFRTRTLIHVESFHESERGSFRFVIILTNGISSNQLKFYIIIIKSIENILNCLIY